MQPNITFRLLSNAPPPNIAAAEVMPEAMRLQRQASAAQPTPRTGLSALFALLGGLQSGPLQSVGIDRTALRQLQAGLLNAPDLARAETLQRALRSNGTFHEGMLAENLSSCVLLPATLRPSRTMSKVDRGEGGIACAGAGRDAGANEVDHRAGLAGMTQNQPLDACGAKPVVTAGFDAPFRYGDEVYNLGVEISEDSASKSAATDPADKAWTAKLSLALPGPA